MKVTMLKPSYLTEDGYVFECGKHNDFSKIVKIIGACSSAEEVAKVLNRSGINYNVYKVVEGFEKIK